MINSEQTYVNLLTLIAATKLVVAGQVTDAQAFATTGRKLPQVSNIPQILQPAAFIIEGDEDVIEKPFALAKYESHALLFVFFRNNGNDAEVPSTQLNNLRDSVIYQLQQRGLAPDGVTVLPLAGGNRQTLGGVVYHARVKGRMLKNEGLQNQQGAIIFPLSILTPM